MFEKRLIFLLVCITITYGQECPSGQCPRKCLDLYPECGGWAALGYCARDPNNLQRAIDMEQNCPVSCKYCDATCDDADCQEDCEARAAKGECTSKPEYMRVRCKKTCNACGCQNQFLSCPWNQANCTSTDLATTTWMHFYCPATCGDCTQNFACTDRDVTTKCPRDWTYSSITDKCYLATPTRKLWAANNALCTSVASGNLASVHSDAENLFLRNLLPMPAGWVNPTFFTPPNNGPVYTAWYFIGLIRTGGFWYTNEAWTDGSPAGTGTYHHWDNNIAWWYTQQPNGNPGEIYTLLDFPTTTGYWEDTYWHDTVDDLFPAFCQQNTCPAL